MQNTATGDMVLRPIGWAAKVCTAPRWDAWDEVSEVAPCGQPARWDVAYCPQGTRPYCLEHALLIKAYRAKAACGGGGHPA